MKNSDKPKFILMHSKETMRDSIISDAVTVGTLLAAYWITKDAEAIWQVIVALMTVIFILGVGVKARTHRFSNIKDLMKWAEDEKRAAHGTKDPSQ